MNNCELYEKLIAIRESLTANNARGEQLQSVNATKALALIDDLIDDVNAH